MLTSPRQRNEHPSAEVTADDHGNGAEATLQEDERPQAAVTHLNQRQEVKP